MFAVVWRVKCNIVFKYLGWNEDPTLRDGRSASGTCTDMATAALVSVQLVQLILCLSVAGRLVTNKYIKYKMH